MINKMILQGRLTRDVELRETNGFKVAHFTIAWSEKYKEKETQLFLNCTAWNSSAEFMNKYFSKGKEIVIEGRLETQPYKDKDGNNRSAINCTVEKIHFCGSKSDSSSNATPSETPNDNGFVAVPDGIDEELPFN